jgi:hypothetical protein
LTFVQKKPRKKEWENARKERRIEGCTTESYDSIRSPAWLSVSEEQKKLHMEAAPVSFLLAATSPIEDALHRALVPEFTPPRRGSMPGSRWQWRRGVRVEGTRQERWGLEIEIHVV